MTTGDRIRQARKAKGYTQTELANIIGLKTAAINKYETNIVVNLKRDTIKQIARALNVSIAWLMGWTDDPDPHVQIVSQKNQPTEQDRLALIDEITQKFSELPQDVKAQAMQYAEFLLKSRGDR